MEFEKQVLLGDLEDVFWRANRREGKERQVLSGSSVAYLGSHCQPWSRLERF